MVEFVAGHVSIILLNPPYEITLCYFISAFIDDLKPAAVIPYTDPGDTTPFPYITDPYITDP
jgi:hypothetical protein